MLSIDKTLPTFSLAIARIFGGFSSAFFEKYHELLPKSEPIDQYELRVDLYELYHYLNHALIFGGVRHINYTQSTNAYWGLHDREDMLQVHHIRWIDF